MNFILEKRMTLISSFSLFFIQAWMAFAYQNTYQANNIFKLKYCTTGYYLKFTNLLYWICDSLFIEFFLPIAVLLLLVIAVSKELEAKYKPRWFLAIIIIDMFIFIVLILFAIPIPQYKGSGIGSLP